MSRPTDLSPVKILVLARLLAAGDKGETEKTSSKDLKPLVEHRWEGQGWADRLGDVLDELESAGIAPPDQEGQDDAAGR